MRGFYRGYWITFWREIPGWAFFFGVYEALKHKYNRVFAGAMAGMSAWLVAIPQDVLKTKIQNSSRKITIKEAMVTIQREDGVKGFFKGSIPLLGRGAALNAIVLPLFDYLNEHCTYSF